MKAGRGTNTDAVASLAACSLLILVIEALLMTNPQNVIASERVAIKVLEEISQYAGTPISWRLLAWTFQESAAQALKEIAAIPAPAQGVTVEQLIKAIRPYLYRTYAYDCEPLARAAIEAALHPAEKE